jgi:hypothetical protein
MGNRQGESENTYEQWEKSIRAFRESFKTYNSRNTEALRAQFIELDEQIRRMDAVGVTRGLIKRYLETAFVEILKSRGVETDAPPAQEEAAGPIRPPAVPEFALHLFLADEELEITVGDLEEKFANDLKKFGRRGAEWLYYKRVGKSTWPYLKRWLVRFGVFAWLADLARRIAG